MGKRIRNIFFNLEKSHIRKDIRKLTTDPSEILEAEKYFNQNLYKCRRNYSDENNQLSFEDLPIPTLSPESTYLGEGLISMEECTKVLNSFSLKHRHANYKRAGVIFSKQRRQKEIEQRHNICH